ncbi:hypothetical protein HYV10_02545 [Candidatus Dependentiae bacterium]|nr:hypothetical protein [Candidatus Dependentiae bacterium]
MKKHLFFALCIGHGIILSMHKTQLLNSDISSTRYPPALLAQLCKFSHSKDNKGNFFQVQMNDWSKIGLYLAVHTKNVDVVRQELSIETNYECVIETLRSLRNPPLMFIGSIDDPNYVAIENMLIDKLTVLRSKCLKKHGKNL